MVEPLQPPQPRSAWKYFGQEFLLMWRLGVARLLSRWWLLLLIVAAGFTFIVATGDLDDRLLQQIRQSENESFKRVAVWLSYWGDIRWMLILSFVLFVVGVSCGCPRWRHICHACLVAAIISTIVVTILRPTFGRARPYAPGPDGFYGPTLNPRYHGFPSGHTTSAFSSAVAVTAASPIIGVPCLLFVSGVSWSRMQLNEHHPMDVLTGAALGTLIGLCCGSAVPGARIRVRRKRSAKS